MAVPTVRDVLVVGGTLAGAAAALAAVRTGSRTRLLVHGAVEPGQSPPIPDDPTPLCEAALERFGTPSPEPIQVFRFRVRRVRRWLDELAIANDDAWAKNLWRAILERCEREGVAVDNVSAAVRLISGPSGVGGAVLVDGAATLAHKAHATILAGGGAAFLWGETSADPPVGLALAVRNELPFGDAGRVSWSNQDGGEGARGPPRFVDGLRGDGRGQFGVAGLAACGEPLSAPWHGVPQVCYVEDVVRGLEAGGFHGPSGGSQPVQLVPLVDEPLPHGFAELKIAKLRDLLARRAGPKAGPEDLERARAELLSMRGEFADYARARAGSEVQVLHQASEVALAHVAARLATAGPG